jgi:BirA family biotin operon repressor/biotin-[acetyl-CoA-carboxylase] ligase
MPQITLTAAVAVVRALRRAAGVVPGIKWPNDLLVDGKKVGGILTEMETESDCIRHLVVGLGLNVNNPGFPPPLDLTATSLAQATGALCSRCSILQAWLEEFEDLYGLFLNREFKVILQEWREYNVTLGGMVTVRQGPRIVSGLALEVAEDGALLLRQESGEVVRVTSGEIDQGPATGPQASY